MRDEAFVSIGIWAARGVSLNGTKRDSGAGFLNRGPAWKVWWIPEARLSLVRALTDYRLLER